MNPCAYLLSAKVLCSLQSRDRSTLSCLPIPSNDILTGALCTRSNFCTSIRQRNEYIGRNSHIIHRSRSVTLSHSDCARSAKDGYCREAVVYLSLPLSSSPDWLFLLSTGMRHEGQFLISGRNLQCTFHSLEMVYCAVVVVSTTMYLTQGSSASDWSPLHPLRF